MPGLVYSHLLTLRSLCAARRELGVPKVDCWTVICQGKSNRNDFYLYLTNTYNEKIKFSFAYKHWKHFPRISQGARDRPPQWERTLSQVHWTAQQWMITPLLLKLKRVTHPVNPPGVSFWWPCFRTSSPHLSPQFCFLCLLSSAVCTLCSDVSRFQNEKSNCQSSSLWGKLLLFLP